MKHKADISLVTTIKEHCRVCYTCVRECPAKAIRISEGQAEVLSERCIGCGNCVRVCSQNAKEVLSSISEVELLLAGKSKVAACLAPSFPAEFDDIEYRRLVGMIRALGFELVVETAFGADLVANRYRQLFEHDHHKRYIATTCPSIVGYIERYHPNLVSSLAPIVSPMIATARALHRLHGDDLKIVFIGPCIAKKGEAATSHVMGEIDAALTFVELRSMFNLHRVSPITVKGSEFDPPRAGRGALFAISRGILQAADIHEDLVSGDVVSAEGRNSFVGAIKEFEAGDLDARLLEVLCCQGCIMGAGMSSQAPMFNRRSCVSHYVRHRLAEVDSTTLKNEQDRFADLDLSRNFESDDQRVDMPSRNELRAIMDRMGKHAPEDELNCGACGYETCVEHAVAIHRGLAESEMCLPYTIERLRKVITKLASAQEALTHSEKLASMGQLAAGIAHEVNNPLGVVIMFAHLLLEELGKNDKRREDLQTIVENADRCKKIVSGLLHFARQNKVSLAPVDLRALVESTAKTFTFPDNINIKYLHEHQEETADVDKDQIAQILTNLISNALAAMPDGGTLILATQGDERQVKIVVSDTGVGISDENKAKIFDPFFTTKGVGKGTGLGLAVTYGIVKMHRGQISVESNNKPTKGPTGTTFTVMLPRHSANSG